MFLRGCNAGEVRKKNVIWLTLACVRCHGYDLCRGVELSLLCVVGHGYLVREYNLLCGCVHTE